MEVALKNKMLLGLIWSMIQRFGVMLISFVSNLILARLLTPEDYGTIGMLLIFISISNTFIDGGFGTALVQKKEPTQEDYSTIFYWNVIVSVILTCLLCIASPYISLFYNLPLLTNILRVMGIVLIINAFSVIQTNILQKKLQFKKLAIINIVASTIASAVAIMMAYNDFGVWSLVFRAIVNAGAISLILWVTTKWKPIFVFSWKSLKGLGKFGGMILLSNLVETVYTEFQGLVIGKVFSAKSLGYYTQAKRLEEIPTLGISSAINQSSFPVYAKYQDDKPTLMALVRKYVQVLSLLVIPIYTILILIAEPIINILFTDKWSASVEMFQILCFIGMIYPLNTINTNVIKSLGKGKLYFNLQFFKRLFGIIAIVCFSCYGLKSMLWASVFVAYVIFIVNAVFSDKLVGYKFTSQIKDVIMPFLLCFLLLCIMYPLNGFLNNYVLMILVQVAGFSFLYYLVLRLFKMNIIYDVVHFLKR